MNNKVQRSWGQVPLHRYTARFAFPYFAMEHNLVRRWVSVPGFGATELYGPPSEGDTSGNSVALAFTCVQL